MSTLPIKQQHQHDIWMYNVYVYGILVVLWRDYIIAAMYSRLRFEDWLHFIQCMYQIGWWFIKLQGYKSRAAKAVITYGNA